MAQIGKLERKAKIKSSPDRVFDLYKNKSNLLIKISPCRLQSIQVLEGDGKSVGSVRLWTYFLGIPVIAKDRIESVDEQNKSITFDLIGGEVTKYYKTYKTTLQACSGDDGVGFAKWTVEYEKASEDVPEPHSNLDFLMRCTKEVDAYLLKA